MEEYLEKLNKNCAYLNTHNWQPWTEDCLKGDDHSCNPYGLICPSCKDTLECISRRKIFPWMDSQDNIRVLWDEIDRLRELVVRLENRIDNELDKRDERLEKLIYDRT